MGDRAPRPVERRRGSTRGSRAARATLRRGSRTPSVRDGSPSSAWSSRTSCGNESALGSCRRARSVTWSVPGARPSPRSILPGWSASSVPNCSAITSGAWFGSMIPPAPTAKRLTRLHQMRDHDRLRRAGDPAQVVVLRDPVPFVAESLGVAYKIDRVTKRLCWRPALHDRCEVEDRDGQHTPNIPTRPLALYCHLSTLAPRRPSPRTGSRVIGTMHDAGPSSNESATTSVGSRYKMDRYRHLLKGHEQEAARLLDESLARTHAAGGSNRSRNAAMTTSDRPDRTRGFESEGARLRGPSRGSRNDDASSASARLPCRDNCSEG